MVTDKRTAQRHDAGFTLVELVIAAALLLTVLFIVTTAAVSGMKSQRFGERVVAANQLSQSLLSQIRNDLSSSVRLFQNDTAGKAYLAALQLNRPGITYTLPVIDENGFFEPDSASPGKTGNSLMFARHAWRTHVTPSTKPYRIDVYRVVHYYLAPADAGPQPGSNTGLTLVKWVSEPLADGEQIDAITDPFDQVAVLLHLVNGTADDDGLVHPAVAVAWLRNEDLATPGTLRQIEGSGVLNNNPVAPRSSPWQLLREADQSRDDLLTYRRHAVASVYAPASWGVGRFGQISVSGGGFPHGLEVQMIGPAAARQVMVRLVVASTLPGHAVHSSQQTVIAARDL